MATHYLEEFATEAEFLAQSADRSKKLGIGSVGEIIFLNKAGAAVEVVDETATQTLTNKTLTSPTLNNPVVISAPVAGGSSLTLVAATHGDKTIALDTLAGTTITLPAATGSGVKFRFVVTVAPTSNQHRINVVGNDAFFGAIFGAQDGGATVEAWEAAADSDQINLNGTTTGGLKGDWIEIEDMVADGWSVRGLISQTGVQATPFATGQVS